ncbi:hypothetical protein [Spirosoma rhododendri]|uniref:Uncharacterized protein n=1 Tax=Spirosoma rhododendri TaxID=2728024 RepID=A0A7L5DT39_9BACT|nr:hypothetical protein [Spirosoma rhododendri]QJD79137.1 hypothetical protein HH216_12440 [Spirosoma rhododendri]
MKVLALCGLLGLTGVSVWYAQPHGPADPVPVRLTGSMPPLTTLTPTPRTRFTPTTRRGYYNLDVVGDFTLPATKSITFAGAGRNLTVEQDWSKLFRRGFSSIVQTRMVNGKERWADGFPPAGWRSRLTFNQRALILYNNYFTEPFGLAWAQDGNKGPSTLYQTPPGARATRNTLYQSAMELQGSCVGFGDCPPGGMQNTYSKIFVDIENGSLRPENEQEQGNLMVYLYSTLKRYASPKTEVGTVWPVVHNSFGYSRSSDYVARPDELWTQPVRHTNTSRQRGLPDNMLGKTVGDVVDFQMPGTYYFYPDFDYTIPHTADNARHWLASLMGEQEVNARLSTKKRIAWQWLFNTQSSDFPNSGKAEHAAPPAIAEGIGIFYWFGGAYGSVFWDDQDALTPDQPLNPDPALRGTGNDRNYACYEHYIHGLWRLFKHHGDLFDGRETYLNDATECSYDGGRTWVGYNANQLKTRDLPFVRAIVNGDQILVAATKPYAKPSQQTPVQVRYVKNGYAFYASVTLNGDEIYLGRATMPRG